MSELEIELEAIRIRRLGIARILREDPNRHDEVELRQALLLLSTAMDLVVAMIAAETPATTNYWN